MGLTLNQKAAIKEAVREGAPLKPAPAVYPSAALADELVIEITGNGGSSSCTLRPSEVSRLRGRYGRGPGFEKWVVDRIRDAMISFGGG